EKAKSGVILDYDKKTKVHDLIYNIKPDLSSLTLVEKYFYNKNKKEIYPEPAQNIKRFNNLDSFTDKKESNDIDDNIDNSVKEGSVNSEISKINILNDGALFDDSDDLNDFIKNCMKEGSEKSEIRTHNEGAEKNELVIIFF
ncbi:MAG: hypothetical protein MHPSP_003421, partial [Paramarteilia canceri]